MSANPGNTGGRFKSFHRKHQGFFLPPALFSFVSGAALRILYCCPSFAPECRFLCSCNAQRKKSKEDLSKGWSRQGIRKISACLGQKEKVHGLFEGMEERGCQVYGWVNFGARGIKEALSLPQCSISAVGPFPHLHTACASCLCFHPPPNFQPMEIHTCCVLILRTLHWSF